MRRRTESNRGQALVETALVLPLVLMILLGIAQFGLIMNAQLTLQNAAREGARMGATGGDDSSVISRVYLVSGILVPSKMTVTVSPEEAARIQGSTVTVKTEYEMDVIIPLISGVIGPELNLSSQVSMRVE